MSLITAISWHVVYQNMLHIDKWRACQAIARGPQRQVGAGGRGVGGTASR